jgi:hypothetical protein
LLVLHIDGPWDTIVGGSTKLKEHGMSPIVILLTSPQEKAIETLTSGFGKLSDKFDKQGMSSIVILLTSRQEKAIETLTSGFGKLTENIESLLTSLAKRTTGA